MHQRNWDETWKLRPFGRRVTAEGASIEIVVHEASVQDRDCAPEVLLKMLEKAPQVATLWADGGYQGPKLASRLEELGIGTFLNIVHKPKVIK